MATKITLLVTVLAYSFVVSQSFMCILALKNVQLNLEGGTYTTLRQLIDTNMRSTFKYVLYTAVIANIILLALNGKQAVSLLFITTAIALVALIADILITVKGNLPVNDIINSWSPDNFPSNWTDYRDKWFRIFQYRQVINIIGFVSLLIGVIFRSR